MATIKVEPIISNIAKEAYKQKCHIDRLVRSGRARYNEDGTVTLLNVKMRTKDWCYGYGRLFNG